MIGFINRIFKSNKHPEKKVRASFDVAQTTTNNKNHWSNTDELSPAAAVKKDVRKKLRERARYEVANNSYARGIINTIANDTIGTGPHLQMLTDSEPFNKIIEKEFNEWAREIGLREKLITGRKARLESGEVFFVFINNDKLKSNIKLDIKVVESDQCTSDDLLSFTSGSEDNADGIIYDDAGNPISYRILKEHPGNDTNIDTNNDIPPIAAENVVHMFKVERPGQPRGVPEILAALPLFAILRRYTLAVLGAAEIAANNAYTISTKHSSLEADNIDMDVVPFDVVDMERNMATVLPAGWEATQMKPEQPTDTYPDFKKEIINEVARCLGVPYNIAAGNSSSYNYASGRLDHHSYFNDIGIERSYQSDTILYRVFEKWMEEAARTQLFNNIEKPKLPVNEIHKNKSWFWDGNGQIDPLKESKAQETRLKNNMTSLAIEAAKVGQDWREIIVQRAKEQKLQTDLGLSMPTGLESNDELLNQLLKE